MPRGRKKAEPMPSDLNERSHFCIGLVLYECQPFIYRVFG